MEAKCKGSMTPNSGPHVYIMTLKANWTVYIIWHLKVERRYMTSRLRREAAEDLMKVLLVRYTLIFRWIQEGRRFLDGSEIE